MSEVEFPVLGEPLAVELANTLYGSGEDLTDFLADLELARGWFAAVDEEGGPVPAGAALLPPRELGRLRELRDAVFDVLTAEIDHTPPRTESFAAINACLSDAPVRWSVGWRAGEGTRVTSELCSSGTSQLFGQLAFACVELLAGGSASALRRCEGPGCSLLFVKDHPRRRWCHSSCGHRARQSRYYYRHRQETP